MSELVGSSLREVARALRAREVSATELLTDALSRYASRTPALDAYIRMDPDEALADAKRADQRLAREPNPPPFCGIPVSVKDLYGMEGQPVHAGTARVLPPSWSRDGWLVECLRAQGAVFVGRTHTVELAFGAVGMNPHWATPRNPWDDRVHRIPGGSSAGAGVSLIEGSALLALGTDTGGSIRIPASMTGTVGHKVTQGRWPTSGVVPLSTTLDAVGALSRSALDSSWFFGAVDPAWGDPEHFIEATERGRQGDSGRASPPIRLAMPRCAVWEGCDADIQRVLARAVGSLGREPGLTMVEIDGGLIDEGVAWYLGSGIAAAECRAFLERELPEWIDLLAPLVGARLRGAMPLDSPRYREQIEARLALEARAHDLFAAADALLLPGHLMTPPPVADLARLDDYLEVNRRALTPTCGINALGLCALSLPVGRDAQGMPVGLQIVAPGGADEHLLAIARYLEQAFGVTDR